MRGYVAQHTSGIGAARASESAEQPKREAEVVRLYHLKYQNYRQIGKKLGIPENSVGPILAKARQRLRAAAEEQHSAG